MKYLGHLPQQELVSAGLQTCVQNSAKRCGPVPVITCHTVQARGVVELQLALNLCDPSLKEPPPRYSIRGTVGPIFGISVLRKNFLLFLGIEH